MVTYPGRSRIDGIRARLDQMRRDADEAVAQVADLRREIDGLRAEVKRQSIDLGEQLTTQAAVIEQLQRRMRALEQRRTSPP